MGSRLVRVLPALLIAILVMSGAIPVSAGATVSQETIAAVAVKAKPSVVGILTTLKATRSTNHGRAAGTGWVYKDGVIITNAHVVENATEVKILYADKKVETVATSNIFADQTSDIAVIKVTAKNLAPLPLGDSQNVTVGQTVIAIGNPLGFRLGNSVSAGILSGTGRTLGSGYPFLQVDAPINPGNSGGPLFNLQGEVIGINSAKMAEIGVEGLGFSIPINTAKQIAETLLQDGKVERTTLGIMLDEGWEAYFGIPDAEGVTISSIIDDGPAGLTALRSNDKLVKLDETNIYTTDDVSAFLLSKKPGDEVTVTVKRGGQVLSVMVKLGSKDTLRKLAEGESSEVGGILMKLTPGQVQEASEFGRNYASGKARINHEYFAVSGSNYAVLYTEYLYVSRRIASAIDFGFEPSATFQQEVASDIKGQVEVQMEINGEKAKFLDGATFTLQQGDATRTGSLHREISYTMAPDGSVVIANGAVRFSTEGLSPTQDLAVVVKQADGKIVTFQFTIKDLR